MMNREFCEKGGGDIISLDYTEISGLLSEVDRINQDNPVFSLKKGKEVEAQRAAVDNLDMRREFESLLYSVYCMDPDPLVPQENVAETDNSSDRQMLFLGLISREDRHYKPALLDDVIVERYIHVQNRKRDYNPH